LGSFRGKATWMRCVHSKSGREELPSKKESPPGEGEELFPPPESLPPVLAEGKRAAGNLQRGLHPLLEERVLSQPESTYPGAKGVRRWRKLIVSRLPFLSTHRRLRLEGKEAFERRLTDQTGSNEGTYLAAEVLSRGNLSRWKVLIPSRWQRATLSICPLASAVEAEAEAESEEG